MTDDVHPLKGRSVLLIEDDYFIMDALRRGFEAQGIEIAGAAPTIDIALALLADAPRLDAAVLDINLQGELAFPVADALTARKVPFVFVTGYDRASVPGRHEGIPRCEKPVHADEVMRAIAGTLAI